MLHPPPDSSASQGVRRARQAEVDAFVAASPIFTAAQLADHLGVTISGARKRIESSVAAGKWFVIVAPQKGRQHPPGQYSANRNAVAATTRAATGFKAWLKKKGETSAEGRTIRTPSTPSTPRSKPAQLRPEPAKLVPIATTAATPLTCGLLNTGEMLLEVGGQSLRLSRSQMQTLVGYLDMVSSALKRA